jgi:diacylglycerol diphosphate phosphatase/phosphatidate phosphatase
MQFLMTPFHRMFYISDLSISFPHAQTERVPVSLLFVYAGAVPLALLILWTVIFRPSSHKAHVTILGLFISLILTSFLTDVIKNAVGRPRPDLLDRCVPKQGTPRDRLVTIEVCTQVVKHTLQDGWRSFPSGHSSFAFSGLGYLALVLAGQLHVFRPHADLSKTLLTITPLIGAGLIAISRLEDYRHDVYDVTIGSLLGITIANFIYRKYYPALRSRHCDTPFPSKEDMEKAGGYGRMRDEEDQGGEFALEDDDPLPLRHSPTERNSPRGSS